MAEQMIPPRATVLVIDNDDGVLAAIDARLSHAGIGCVHADNGAQGVMEFDPDRIDLVITDLNMPALDGFGVIRNIRSRSDVPIIVITGFRDEYAGAIRRMPNILMVEKPFSLTNLIDVIDAELFVDGGRCAA
ncbi:MAG: response regulator [Planctomycetota bacterium]